MPTENELPPALTTAPQLLDFLAAWRSPDAVVRIGVEPETIYVERGRHGSHLNFDFTLTGLTDRELELVFLKVALYDADQRLLTYRFLNRNAVGPAGIQTLVTTRIDGAQQLHLFNPFHTFPSDLSIGHLRYMFTFRDVTTAEEFYYGDVIVTPQHYDQIVELELPVKGLLTILDGHDYFSHHRRFDMSILRPLSGGGMQTNGARYALDLVHLGEDGNTRRIPVDEPAADYDFRFDDARRFYSDRAPVFAPAAGTVVAVVDGLPDHYDIDPFDSDAALAGGRSRDLAGNHVVIRHNDGEFSHLFHLLSGSVTVEVGQEVVLGERLGRIGFSGAATVYSHLHYVLMDGPDFQTAESLPVRFRRVTLVLGDAQTAMTDVAIDTGDILLAT